MSTTTRGYDETDDACDLTGKIMISSLSPEFIGSYSVVYRGMYGQSRVAVKIIKSVGALHAMRRKVSRERAVWEALHHPNILPFYGHADDEMFQPFGAFISPWYSNGDSGRFLEERGQSLDVAARIQLWEGVVNGVAFLHSCDPIIVHGDLKPGNVLIDDDGDPRICDFGLVRILQEGGTSGMTTTTEHTGTERYLAPELVTSDMALPTTATDVYALGCIGLEFVYLERPYSYHLNNHRGCIIVDIRAGVPPATSQTIPDVTPYSSWGLIEPCWVTNPEWRPSALQILRSLRTTNLATADKPATRVHERRLQELSLEPPGVHSHRSDTFYEESRQGPSMLPSMLTSQKILSGHTDWVRSVAFSPDGKRIVSGSKDKTIRLWDAKTGDVVLGPLEGHSRGVMSIAFSPDGRRVASGSWDMTIRVWNTETGEVVAGPLLGHSSWVSSVAFSPDGKRIVSGSDDKTIRVWDAETGEPLVGPFKGHTRSVRSVAFSPLGWSVVSGSLDETIRQWDSDTGAEIARPLKGHSDDVRSVAFSPDGRRIVSGSDDRTVLVWDAETSEVVAGPFTGHSGWVSSVAFSPDGNRIISGSHDKTIRVWDSYTGEALEGSLHSGVVRSVAFSPDGRRVASGSDDQTVRVWDVDTGEQTGSLRCSTW